MSEQPTPTEPRTCVYTVMIGGYETLNDQPAIRQSALPAICLTDDPLLRSSFWEVRHIVPRFPMDPVRSQRDIKLRPHLYLPEFDRSLYIDNTVVLSAAPEKIIETYAAPAGIALPHHSFRGNLLDEFVEVMRLSYDDPSRIAEQLNHYALHAPHLLEEQAFWTAILIRDHHRPEIIEAMEQWAAHVLRYSRRDQLSANYAFHAASIVPGIVDIDNYSSWFHTWPAKFNRPKGGARLPSGSTLPPVARIRQLERQVEALIAENAGLRATNAKLKDRNTQLRAEAKSVIGRAANLARRTVRRVPLLASLAGPAKATSPKAAATAVAPDRVVSAIGKTIYVAPRDRRGVKLVKSGGNLNPTSLAIWTLLLEEGGWTHIVDIGANYGEMLLSVDIGTDIAVTAVEPNQNIVPALKRSFAESGLKVTLREVAIAPVADEVRFLPSRKWSGVSRVVDEPHKRDVRVPAITLEMLLSEIVPAPSRVLLKIDVEGLEAQIIASGLDALGRLDSFRIMIELLHASRADFEWLAQNFDISLYHRESKELHRAPGDVDEMLEMLRGGAYFAQDAVLSRRGAAPLTIEAQAAAGD